MNTYNFDVIHQRRGTHATKWDALTKLLPQYEPSLLEDVIPLWIADMDLQAPVELIDSMRQVAEHGIYGYTSIPRNCSNLVQRWELAVHNWEIDPSGILFCNGVYNSILTTLLALTNPSDEVIYFTPVYGPMRSVIVDFQRTAVPYKPHMDGDFFEIDFSELEALITPRTKMLLLCNPHNPGGTFWSKKDLERISSLCLKHNIIICSNDIHADLKYSESIYTPVASISKEVANITVTQLSPSKTFNLGGQKISHMYIENQQLRKKIGAVNISILGNHPFTTFGVAAFESVYAHGMTWYKELMAYLQANRDFAIDFIQSKIPRVRAMKPQGTYLIWLDCRDISTDEQTLMDIFVKDAKVLLSNGIFFGEGGLGYMRLNFACPRALLEEGLVRIEKALG